MGDLESSVLSVFHMVAAAALKANGLNSSQVVAINIANGVLTIFAKTA
jgi:hypothetical protein